MQRPAYARAQQAFQYAYSCYKTDAAQSYSQPCFNGQAGWTQDLAGNLLVPANTWAGARMPGYGLAPSLEAETMPRMKALAGLTCHPKWLHRALGVFGAVCLCRR